MIVFNDHCSMREITENEMDLAGTYGVDCFIERSFEIDTGVQMPRFVTLSVFSIGADETAFDRPKAFPVGIVEGRVKFFADEFG